MTQTVITVYEDRKKHVPLTHSQKTDILSFRTIIGGNHIHLDYDGTLQVMKYVGFISKGNTRLQILPKIYEKTSSNETDVQRESMRVMQNLLRVSEFNKILQLPDQTSSAEQLDLMELFIGVFADKIISLYSRQMYREYIDIEENSTFVKGRIQFSENIRQNPVRMDRHVVNYQNYEQNNALNNIIKTMVIRLLRLTQDSNIKNRLKKALLFLDDASETLLSIELFDSVRFTRLNMQFKPVFEMAKMFFLNLSPESYAGDETVFSFLVPLNELFEYYLYKVFSNLGNEFNAKYQNRHRFVFSPKGDDVYIKPDILLEKSNKLVLIADAKYKNPNYENGRYTKINQSDIYQVFAYARAYGINNVALVYPLFDDHQTPPQCFTLKDSNGDIALTIACVDVKNPVISDHGKYLQKLLIPSDS